MSTASFEFHEILEGPSSHCLMSHTLSISKPFDPSCDAPRMCRPCIHSHMAGCVLQVVPNVGGPCPTVEESRKAKDFYLPGFWSWDLVFLQSACHLHHWLFWVSSSRVLTLGCLSFHITQAKFLQ
jgi:hypothetical protein